MTNERAMRIQPAVRSAIVADCDARRPDEACGVLLADEDGRIVEAVPVDNVWPEAAERPHRFAIDPLTQLNIERQADADGRRVAGYYHSHPTAPAVPSEFDRGRAWATYLYLIVGYSDGLCVEFRVWALDDRESFVEHAVAFED